MKNSIYNTVDDVPVVQSVEKIIDVVLSKPELTWAALLDTAFDYDYGEARLDFGSAVNCYDFPEMQRLSAVAPCLVALYPHSDLRGQVTRLVRNCQGRPMLSFVGTTKSLKAISEKWRAIHMVSVVDEQEMLLRFADTRVLSYLPQVLTPSQWGAICGSISHWVYFNRSGNLTTCDIFDCHDLQEKISITNEQLEKLLDASHPDALMELIFESMSDIVPNDSRMSKQYEMISGSWALAKKYKIEHHADVLALAVSAYLTKGKSNADQRLEILLHHHQWPVGSLGDAIVDTKIIEAEEI